MYMAATLKLQLLLLLPLFAFAASSSASSSQNREGGTTCQSVECLALAAEIASRMNVSADPCQDFFNYACGNFPNVIKYNPLKAAGMSSVFKEDYLFEDTIGLMTDKVERNIYELLVLDRVVTTTDADMSGLYNFTRIFYRSCRRWMQLNSDWSSQLQSRNFLRSVFNHLNQTMQKSSSPSLESTLAALVKTGGLGILTVDLPSSFAESVLSKDDFNLTKTARARIEIPSKFNLYGLHRRLEDVATLLEKAVPVLNFSKKYGALRKTYADLYETLSKRSPWVDANCTVNLMQEMYTVTELNQLAACARPEDPFSWTQFFEELLNTSVDPLALVETRYPSAVIDLVTFFKSRQNSISFVVDPKGAVSDDAAFLIFDWLLSFATFFPNEFQEKWLDDKEQAIPKAQGESTVVCMKWTRDLLQPIVERMYQKAYHREDFKDVNQFVQLIKSASINSVRRQSWITSSAKEAIVKKIQSMKQSIGLDDLTANQLKSFYRTTLAEFRSIKLQPDSLENNFGSLVSLARCANARKSLDIMSGGSPVSLFMNLINPLVVNAFNWIQKNEIIFPMAILAPPMYHPSYPEYINLGSLGYIIGHEIGHSFDNMGHTINQMGASGHFWDSGTEAKYLRRMECVRSRYGRFTLYPGGPAHNSNTTLGNDIADIIGIKAATEALKMLKRSRGNRPMPRLPNLQTDFSPERMLFIQTAQSWCIKSEPHVLKFVYGSAPTHSPHHLRIRGIAENSPEFAEAFNCRRGQQMNPSEKCSFW